MVKNFFPWIIVTSLIFLFAQFFTLSYIAVSAQLEANQKSPTSSSTADATSTKLDYLPLIRVIDGDTIDVFEGGEVVRVRLIGVDTPEVVDPRKPVQCFGEEASAKTREILALGVVRLVSDSTQGVYDKYQRRLAYVFTPDGTHLNHALIREGYAHEYTYRTPYEYQVDFKRAEREAREAKRGLWADGVCALN